MFGCGRNEGGRDGCRWAGSGGGQSRIKGTASVNELAVERHWHCRLGCVRCWGGEWCGSGAELALTATKTTAQPQNPIAQRLQWQRGATYRLEGGGSAMGAPCEGVAPPNGGQDWGLRGSQGSAPKKGQRQPCCCCLLHVVFLSFFSQPLCRTQSASRPVCHQSNRCWGLFLPNSPRRCFRGLSNSSTWTKCSVRTRHLRRDQQHNVRQVKPTGQQVNGHHQASQGPLNLKISWPGSRGCVSVSECRQTMPAAVARWSVSATNATTARIILRECLGHHRISAPHPRHVEIKYHLSLFSIFNSPFPAQMESKSRRGQSVVRVHGVGPRQELSLKPSPLCPPSSAATRSRTVCRGGNR